MNYLGVKALDCLRVAEAADDPDEYVYRQVAASKRHQDPATQSDKPLTRKFEELTRRGYLTQDARRHLAWRLTTKGERALAEHLGLATIPPLVLPAMVAKEMAAHVGEVYPEEGCGAVLDLCTGPAASDLLLGRYEVYQGNNIQSLLHQRYPRQFPKSGREAYAMHPDDVTALQRRVSAGARLVAIYHSHCDTPPIFSRDDAIKALHGDSGLPLFPDTDWLVLGVSADKPEFNKMGAYRWHPVVQDFLPVRLVIGTAESTELTPVQTKS